LTVGNKMHTTLSSLTGAATSLKTFGLETEDQNAKQMFFSWSEQVANVAKSLEGRVNYIEQQEPQYKVTKQTQQQR